MTYSKTLIVLLAALTSCADGQGANCRSVANFDNLKVGASPSNGYAGLNWHGWTVATPPGKTGAGNGIVASTKPNVLMANDPQTSSITINNGTAASFSLDSFDAACYGNVNQLGDYPVNCTVSVTGKVPFVSQSAFSTSLFQYTKAVQATSASTPASKMQRFTSSEAGTVAFFALLGPPVGHELPGDTQLIVDRVVVTNISC